MASSQRTIQFLFCGETILSQGKHYIMNVWDYYEREAKKKWAFSEVCLENTQRLPVKDFSSSWNILTIHLLASWNDHLLTFLPNHVYEKNMLVCNICLALTTNLLTCSLQSHVLKQLLHRKCMGSGISPPLVAPIKVLFVASPSGFGKLHNE